nr:protein kinase [Leptolyngbya ohadii]
MPSRISQKIGVRTSVPSRLASTIAPNSTTSAETPATTLALLESLLPVLQFVHDRGSIHRDIKPSNIMRRKDGTLFLLDFGAVKQATASNPGQAQSSSTGIYSQGFAPPEQMKGNQVYPATEPLDWELDAVTPGTPDRKTRFNKSHPPPPNSRSVSSIKQVTARA